jgi:choline-sulfatase
MNKPNILIIMTDQFNGTFFPDGPAEFLHAPHLKALAKRSARFQNAYTASPLCAPARASFMSGQLPSRTGVYDNAAEFQSSIPTFAHHLRNAGYYTCLSGKMHFVGPDQLHGFEERLTTDIYPADFGWTPDYRKQGERIDWWYHNLGSVTGAGAAETSNQLEYDDEVTFLAVQKLHQLGRVSTADNSQPWCLTVSLTHPHDPYVARKKYWDLYEGIPQLQPEVGPIKNSDQDPHSRRLHAACNATDFDITPEHIAQARQGYFANISYVDDKIGEVLAALKAMRMDNNTIVVFASDHGDMLGERGLWFKMNFFEGSARVPLMIAAPGMKPGPIETPVSTLDVTPTLCELAGLSMDAIRPWTDGTSLVGPSKGNAHPPVLIEYAAEGTVSPMVGIRDGNFKFIACAADPDMLFDVAADPHEMENLAGDPAHAATLKRLSEMAKARWDLAHFDAAVRESQARRWVVYPALRNGNYYPWDFQPLQKASERYMRNHMDLNVLEESKRFPRGE